LNGAKLASIRVSRELALAFVAGAVGGIVATIFLVRSNTNLV
jgi:hypothetical protein